MEPPTHSYVAYIDEAGDEGFKFTVNGKKGSSDWFVLSAAIIRAENDIATTKLVDGVRAKLGMSPKTMLHFKNLDHKKRLPYIDEIARARLRVCSVLIHKPSLNTKALKDSERLYFYAGRLLLERVSWFCRDAPKTSGDGSVLIVFSNRSTMRYADFRAYLGRLFDMGSENNIQIAWNVIKDSQIITYQAADRKGLQIADAVASGFFAGLEKNRYGFTEGRYAQMLKPVVYERSGNFTSYGLKFMPATPSVTEHPWLADFPK